ncbi:FG-GAP-like repeat-containing protein [Mucilaginibacter sp. CAU 1740]|uniref:FG-GAP-like repeat-containing protein n=1 Tax=Mucilaginibacter sp. CAU 1740 TaxID=3140365 RepID=UPI00325BA4D6
MKIGYSFFILLLMLTGINDVLAQVPTLTSFAPTKATVGASVTITGTNFASDCVVFFGPVKANVTSFSATQLIVTVPVGAGYQRISVTNPTTKLSVLSATQFTPVFTPLSTFSTSDMDPSVDLQQGNNPVATAVADIDVDGKPDIISLNSTDNTLSVFINGATGYSITTGSFSRTDFATVGVPLAMAVADFNGDGKPDIAVVHQGSNALSVFTNLSTYTASPLARSISFRRLDWQLSGPASAIAMGDVDRDGRVDIVVNDLNSNNISVIRNITSTGTTYVNFTARVDIALNSPTSALQVADLNGDGKPDIIAGSLASRSISLLKNVTSGAFTAASYQVSNNMMTGVGATSIYATDIDQSGMPDLVVTSFAPTQSAVFVYRNTLTGSGASFTATSFSKDATLTTLKQPVSVALADVDGDGKQDIVAGNYDDKVVSIFKNNSTSGSVSLSTFGSRIDFTVGNSPFGIAANDLDGDGKADLIAANDLDNTISIVHAFNANSVPGPAYAESTAANALGSFINTDILDNEWKQEAPVGSGITYTIAPDASGIVNQAQNAPANAGRFVYFSTVGSTSPLVKMRGNLTFTARGSGTIEVQLIRTSDLGIAARKTFLMSGSFTDYGWSIRDLDPQKEYIFAVMFNGGNSSAQATGEFKKNLCLTLQQAGMSGAFRRYRADASSLIGNVETQWYGWSDQYNAARKKYLQHSAYARMRFTTDATRIAIEYVRDFYDKRAINRFPMAAVKSGFDFDAAGNIVSGYNAINSSIKVTEGKTYTISGLLTTNPTYVFFDASGNKLGPPQSLVKDPAHTSTYKITAPASAARLAILVQRVTNPNNFNDPVNDLFTVYTSCMIEDGVYGAPSAVGGGATIPSAYSPYAGDKDSNISGPAVFINGSLYKYYQVEGNDQAKIVQYVSDALPAGTKTVEVMMPGQGTYSVNGTLVDPHIRRSGNYLRAVYLLGTTTTVSPSTTAASNSVLFIHDSILSGFNISSDAQNNVWMMKIARDPAYGFTGDIFSEGYAGRILHTDTQPQTGTGADPDPVGTFAQKLANYNVGNYWFQIGVNDYGFATPLNQYYTELKGLVEKLHTLKPSAKIYIQSVGPQFYEDGNSETYADNGLAATGPTANDFRDVQRAVGTGPGRTYCGFVDFENLFPATIDYLADGIHPTDLGNQAYANGIRDRSTLLGNTLPSKPLAFYRNSIRQFIQNVPGIATITATGGQPNYTFTRLSGTMPTGLTFNSDGTITGTPTLSGVVTLSVKVTDGAAATITQDFVLTVKPIPTVIVAPVNLVNAQAGVLYKTKLHGALGYGKYTLTHTATPSWLTFNDITGDLSGTPPAGTTGTFNFRVSATDHWGFTGFTDYSFKVGTGTPPPLSDKFEPTISVSADNHLLVTGNLHDLYSNTFYSFIGAYYSQNGGAEIYLGDKNVNVELNSLKGTTVDLGQMRLNAGTFNVRLYNYGIAPTAMDGVNFTFDQNISFNNRSTSYTTPPIYAAFSMTAYIDGNGHLIVTGHVPRTFTSALYAYCDGYYTQSNNPYNWISGQNVIIPANAKDGTPVDFGYVGANPGSLTIRLHNYGIDPASANGVDFTYNVETYIPANK